VKVKFIVTLYKTMDLDLGIDETVYQTKQHQIWGNFFSLMNWKKKYYKAIGDTAFFVITTNTGIENLEVDVYDTNTYEELNELPVPTIYRTLRVGNKPLSDTVIGIYCDSQGTKRDFVIPKITFPNSNKLDIGEVFNLAIKILGDIIIFDDELVTTFINTYITARSGNTPYIQLKLEDKMYYVWYSKYPIVWLVQRGIKIGSNNYIKNFTFPEYYSSFKKFADDIIKTQTVSYSLSYKWSECGYVKIDSKTITPYHLRRVPEHTISITKNDVDRNDLIRDILQMLKINNVHQILSLDVPQISK